MSEKILIIDDLAVNLSVLTETLEPEGYEIFAASNGDQGLKLAARILPDLILLDVVLPGRDGFTICRLLKENEITREIPVLFVTAKQDVESLLRGFKLGGLDYISKPFRLEEVVARVSTHLKINRLTRELKRRNEELETEIERRRVAEADRLAVHERLSALSAQEVQRWGLPGLVGESPLIQKILSDIQRLHQFSNTHVLIMGESGTGKELVARAIHYGSQRSAEPFIPVNCAAIPAELAESTFFGHIRGSFTGATSDRKGCFELADGGTLFLDEIGDMDPLLQAKLLRVLEGGEIVPVGSTRSKQINVRVLSATNADLTSKIANGGFRQDLYFRLARYTVITPPLRNRREDIPLLAQHFLSLFTTEMGLTSPVLTPEAQKLLGQYSFPGNVREMKNIIERALIESGGEAIAPEHLHLRSATPATPGAGAPDAAAMINALPLNLQGAEQALIHRAIQESGGNITEAARLLGVNRSRIYRRFAK